MIQPKRVTVSLMKKGKIQVMLDAHTERREVIHASTDVASAQEVLPAYKALVDLLVADPITQSFPYEDLLNYQKELRK